MTTGAGAGMGVGAGAGALSGGIIIGKTSCRIPFCAWISGFITVVWLFGSPTVIAPVGETEMLRLIPGTRVSIVSPSISARVFESK